MNRRSASAFEATALPYLGAVYDAALRLVGEPASAEDLTQETFLRAFRSFHTYREGTNCRAWLLRIAYNLFCTDYRRGRRLSTVTLEGDDDGLATDPPSSEPGPELQTIRMADREAVWAAVAQLPENFRVAVTLVDLQGLSCAEAAEIMGTPRGTVLSRLHRARRRLEAMLLPALGWVDSGDL